MNYVVLVKQVPDIKHIPQDAWDWDTGTLRRAFLENVCNGLDKQALAFALELKKQRPGRIVALSMGPPFADEVLRYAIAAGADAGVLLSDRRLGGADTPATAYPLACAIRKIEREIFEGDPELLVLAGMQSVDGDTAHVPPQIAEELGMDHVAYVTGYAFDESGELTLRRVIRNGTETVAVTQYPSLLTLTEWTLPPYPTFHRTRRAFAQNLYRWDADAIGADAKRIGLSGSRTGVVKIFPAKQTRRRRGFMVKDSKELIARLTEVYGTKNETSPEDAEGASYRLPADKEPEYRGDVWIFAESEDGSLHPVAFELLGKARELASVLGEQVGAVLAGSGVDRLAPELIAGGADSVFVVDDERLARFIVRPYTRALTRLMETYRPQVFLFGATPLGRELAPRVAYATESGLTADCTELGLTDIKRGRTERIGILKQTRPALGGNIMARIVSQNSRVQMSTVRPGVLKAIPRDNSRTGRTVRFSPDLGEGPAPGIRIRSVEREAASSDLAGASIVVAGGLGCRTKENFDGFVGGLATALQNRFGDTALTAGSRQAVEAGFIGRDRQVGQTGYTVSPKLYLALGISGAVQHVTGFQNSGIVVAVDKDPAAPVFRTCDFGIVGDLESVVPDLLANLNSSKTGAHV